MLQRLNSHRDRPRIGVDPLSEILSLLKLGSYGFRGLAAGGDWALSYPPGGGIKCFAVQTGRCWFALEGASEPVLVLAGDFMLTTGERGYLLYSERDSPPVDAFALFSAIPAGETAVLNAGGEVLGMGGYFGFEGGRAELLMRMLPPVVHIRAESEMAGLRWSIERMMRELREPQPGSALIAQHLAQAMLVEALRAYSTGDSHPRAGWLFALADLQMRRVIEAMHAEPSRNWTLETLAQVAGMSRSSFAARFKSKVGEPAMHYLTRWRMMLASDRLARGGMSISVVAPSVGYESESAFGAAFKRMIGHSPRQFARAAVNLAR